MALSLVPEVLAHVIDVHCHPTDAENIDQQDVSNLQITICAMSASTRDQDLVKSLAQSSPTHVIPAFGEPTLRISVFAEIVRLSSMVFAPYILDGPTAPQRAALPCFIETRGGSRGQLQSGTRTYARTDTLDKHSQHPQTKSDGISERHDRRSRSRSCIQSTHKLLHFATTSNAIHHTHRAPTCHP